MKIYVVRYGDESRMAVKNLADAEEYVLHEAYLNALYACIFYDFDWNETKFYYKNTHHCFNYLGAYAMHRESIDVIIEEVDLED
jgi:hypothetical protein